MDRCAWCGADPLYVAYHDTDWGVPERDARALWEKLVLDGFQAGLSWITILRKRENFRAAFQGFHPSVIASWGDADIARLLDDPGIVRSRAKIEATIGNARAYLSIQGRDGFAQFLWRYVDGQPLQTNRRSMAEVPPQRQRFQKDFWQNDGGSDVEVHPAFHLGNHGCQAPKVEQRRGPDSGSISRGVHVDNIGADGDVHRDGQTEPGPSRQQAGRTVRKLLLMPVDVQAE